MSPTRFLTILRRHLRQILLAAVVCGATTAYFLKDLPTNYTATAQVVIDINASTSGNGTDVSPFIIDKYIATQVDIISSQAVALRVVRKLRLAEEAPSPQAPEAVIAQAKERSNRIATELRKLVDVKPGRDSSVITITAVADDAARARDLANAWAHEYLAESLDMRVNPAKQSSAFLREEAETLRKTFEEAQLRATRFQREHGLTSTDERLDAENVRLGELATELSRIEALRIDTSNRRSMADEASRRAAGADLPAVQHDTLIQQLRANLAVLEGKRKERASMLGPNHPEILQIKEEVSSAQAQLAEATASLTRGIGLSQRMTTQRETELAAAVDRQRKKVLDLRALRDQWAVLQRDQDNARQAYETLRQRVVAQAIESRSTLTGASLLADAPLPPEPWEFIGALKVAASALLAMVLAGGLVVAWDLRAPRVQGRADLARVLGDAPVIRVRRAGRKYFRRPPASGHRKLIGLGSGFGSRNG